MTECIYGRGYPIISNPFCANPMGGPAGKREGSNSSNPVASPLSIFVLPVLTPMIESRSVTK